MAATTKTIDIGGQEVALRCSAATYVLYREEFRADLFTVLESFIGAQQGGEAIPDGVIDAILKATYIMARQADPEEDRAFIDWLDQFGLIDSIESIQPVVQLLLGDRKRLNEAKKKKSKQSAG